MEKKALEATLPRRRRSALNASSGTQASALKSRLKLTRD